MIVAIGLALAVATSDIQDRLEDLPSATTGIAAPAPQSQQTLRMDETGRLPSWKQSHLAAGNAAINSLYIYAVCARNHRLKEATALLATPRYSPDEPALASAVFPSGRTDCPIRGGLRVRDLDFVRGAVAEAIYNGDNYRPRNGQALAPTPVYESNPRDKYDIPRWVARCAVHRAPKLAHDVVHYGYGSIGEERSLRALSATFMSCLPSTQPLSVSRIAMRILIAEQLYQATQAFAGAFDHA